MERVSKAEFSGRKSGNPAAHILRATIAGADADQVCCHGFRAAGKQQHPAWQAVKPERPKKYISRQFIHSP